MRRVLHSLGFALSLLACQSYDFQHLNPAPVVVIHDNPTLAADAGTAYIMIVQDISGSMTEPISSTSNESKIHLVSQDFSQVLEEIDGGDPFFIGLTAFPAMDLSSNENCGLPAVIYPIASSASNIPKILTWYAGAQANDGTPTAAALTLAAKDPALVTAPTGGARYIVLLTDGYPNCNPNHPCASGASQYDWSNGQSYGCESAAQEQFDNNNNATPPAACVCSFGACPTAGGADCCTKSNGDSALEGDFCLDDVNTESVITQLHNQGITTFVVGVGSDFTNYNVLNAMATAGGTGTAYQANSVATLLSAIQTIIGNVTTSCSFGLNPAPANAELVQVVFNGANLTLGDVTNGFTYNSGTVLLGSTPCNEIKGGQGQTLEITALGSPQ